jgi:hypothetical protein
MAPFTAFPGGAEGETEAGFAFRHRWMGNFTGVNAVSVEFLGAGRRKFGVIFTGKFLPIRKKCIGGFDSNGLFTGEIHRLGNLISLRDHFRALLYLCCVIVAEDVPPIGDSCFGQNHIFSISKSGSCSFSGS